MVALAEVIGSTDTFGSAEAVARLGSAEQGRATFTGYVADNETGLLHARARQYSPTLGRFVGRDPIGYLGGIALYHAYFVPNDLDSLGLIPGKKPVRPPPIVFPPPPKPSYVYIETNHSVGGLAEDYRELMRKRKSSPNGPNTETYDGAKSPSDIANDLEDAANKQGSADAALIGGHGSGTGISTGPDTTANDFREENLTDEIVRKIRNATKAGAVIMLCGCHTGENPAALQALANILNRRVCGCSKNDRGGTGELYSPCDCCGDWKCASPMP